MSKTTCTEHKGRETRGRKVVSGRWGRSGMAGDMEGIVSENKHDVREI